MLHINHDSELVLHQIPRSRGPIKTVPFNSKMLFTDRMQTLFRNNRRTYLMNLASACLAYSLCLHWPDPGTVYKIPNRSKIVKKYDFDGLRRVPGEVSKNDKKYKKNTSFGGPSESPRKIVLGKLNIVNKCQNIFF